jgi:hypothetical protein
MRTRDEPAQLARLRADLQRLYDAVSRWSDSRWAARAADGRSRGDVLFALVCDLAVLGARAGSGAPSSTRPARVAPHAVADQLAVVGADLVAAPNATALAGEALDAVAATRRMLLGS